MLPKIQELIDQLHTNRIIYCHWKSNFALTESLDGKTDIDLLIHRQDTARFRTILSQLCFKPADTTDSETFPSMEHFYALDTESGVLIHVHAYYRVITGESLTKNYHLPIEALLLKTTREMNSVRVPIKSAELVVFPLRIMLKHTSTVELLLLSRYWKEVKPEIEWLLEGDSLDETIGFVKQWLPALDADLFIECVTALKSSSSLFQRVFLGHRLRSQLRPYSRHSTLHNWFSGVRKFTKMLLRHIHGSQRGMVLRSGGVIIAFVGSDGTGKSTLLTEMKSWLGKHFDVEQIHAGKPKSTLLSFIPNFFAPILRSLLPSSRTTVIEAKNNQRESQRAFPFIFSVRSVLLAYDRHRLLSRAFGHAANRTIVLCDRYPSTLNGTPDSPQLSKSDGTPYNDPIRQWLTNTEAQLYREIPPPDLVVYLTAPLEVTLARNASREEIEPEAYVRMRHDRSSGMEFGKAPVVKINTDQSLSQTVQEVKRAIWNVL